MPVVPDAPPQVPDLTQPPFVLPPAPPKPPTTTAQQDITLAGQRRVNIIWEVTQAIIALTVTVACIVVGVHVGLSPTPTTQVPSILSNAFFLIVGFYFSRTNHSAIGGLGRKANESQEYEGR